jgi:hypothetical protein
MKRLFKGIISLVLVASSLGLSQVAHASGQAEDGLLADSHNVDPSSLKVVDSSNRKRFGELSLNDLYEEIGSLISQRKRICGEPEMAKNLSDSKQAVAEAWSMSFSTQDLSAQKYEEANLHYQIGGTCWTAYKQAFDAQVIYGERAHLQVMASANQNRKPTSFR